MLDGSEGPILADAQTIVDLVRAEGGDVEYDTESILLFTTSVSGNVQTWRAPRDGFILGWLCSAGSQFMLTINLDPPAANAAAGGVYTGAVWYSAATNPAATQANQLPPLRHRFKANDAINVRTLSATTVLLWLFVGYPQTPT